MIKEVSKNYQVGEDFVQTLRQIGSLTLARYPGIRVVDIDVAPAIARRRPSLKNLAEAEQRMLEIAGDFDRTQRDGKVLYDEALGIHAFVVDLEMHEQAVKRGKTRGQKRNIALESSLELRLPWRKYCEATGGFTPGLIPDHVIDEQYNRTEAAFQELGFNFDPKSWQAFLKDVVLGPKEFKMAFKAEGDRVAPIFRKLIKFPESLKYKPKIENVDKAWVNWITGNRNGLVLKINAHPRNSSRLWKGNVPVMVAHEELAHITQARMLEEAIRLGKINPANGIMTVPGLEQFGSEGIALNLPYLLHPLLESLSPDGRFALEYTHLRNMVLANVIFDLNKDNPPTRSELIERALHFLPPETKDRISNLLDAARYDPVDRSYRRAYSDGGYFFWLVAQELSQASCLDLVTNFFSCPMTPKEIKEWVCTRKKEEKEKHLAKTS